MAMADRDEIEKQARKLTVELASKGRLIEAGFAAFRVIVFPGATPGQLASLRMAYMAGAQHLFASIMSLLEPGEEPTTADLTRMDLIHAELEVWRAEMTR